MVHFWKIKKKKSVLTTCFWFFGRPRGGGVKGQKHNFQRVYRKFYYFSPLVLSKKKTCEIMRFFYSAHFTKFTIYKLIKFISQKILQLWRKIIFYYVNTYIDPKVLFVLLSSTIFNFSLLSKYLGNNYNNIVYYNYGVFLNQGSCGSKIRGAKRLFRPENSFHQYGAGCMQTYLRKFAHVVKIKPFEKNSKNAKNLWKS